MSDNEADNDRQQVDMEDSADAPATDALGRDAPAHDSEPQQQQQSAGYGGSRQQQQYDRRDRSRSRSRDRGRNGRSRSPRRDDRRSPRRSRSPANRGDDYSIDRQGTSAARDERPRELDPELAEYMARQPVDPEKPLQVRFLLDSKCAGQLLGKGGSNINRIRDECHANMTLLYATQGTPEDRRDRDHRVDAPERVMDVRGTNQQITGAVRLISEELLKFYQTAVDPRDVPRELEQGQMKITWLLPSRQLGAVIGKGGKKAQMTTAATGARLHGENSVLLDSTEKIMVLRGTPAQVESAFRVMLIQYEEEGDTPQARAAHPFRPYIPANALRGGGGGPPRGDYGPPPPGRYGGGGGYNGRDVRDSYGAPPPGRYGPPPPRDYDREDRYGAPPPRSSRPPPDRDYRDDYPRDRSPPPQRSAPRDLPPGDVRGGGRGPAPPLAADAIVQQVVIPTETAGSVIGKGGAIITRIRQDTNCQVNVLPVDPARPHERYIEVNGAQRDVDAAIEEIRQCVRRHEEREAGRGGRAGDVRGGGGGRPPVNLGGGGYDSGRERGYGGDSRRY